MKFVKFYLEYPDAKSKRKATRKKPDGHSGNVVAVFDDTAQCFGGDVTQDAAGAVYFERNSPVCMTQVSWGYLREKCKRISESMAREIHPQLFTYLEQ